MTEASKAKLSAGKASRLTEAAEALVEAATLEADGATNKEVVAALESLKTSFDNKLNTVIQKIDSSNENLDAKINSLNQHLGAIKMMMEEEHKQTRLHRALEYVKLSSFTYLDRNGGQGESYFLAKNALMCFSLGHAYMLPHGSVGEYIDDDVAKSEQAFRNKFSEQMKELINRDPRLVKGENGVWTMYYS